MTVIALSRTIGPVPLSCWISERHNSDVEITANPIETGAEVNDHAYIKPKKVTLEVADAGAAATYMALVKFQEARTPFILVTGLNVYKDMLIQSMDVTRDKTYSRILKATVTCRQVIIVETAAAEGGEKKPGGKDGGKDSKSSSNPSKSKSTDARTGDRASASVNRGDQAGSTVSASKSQSLAKRMFGS